MLLSNQHIPFVTNFIVLHFCRQSNTFSRMGLKEAFRYHFLIILITISFDTELKAYQWSINVNRGDIFHWFNTFYVVPSSTATITTSRWLEQYHSSRWATFEEFTKWQTSCWLVSLLTLCTCPIGLKQYTCKHSVGLGIMYQVIDNIRCERLGKRKGKNHPKKVRTALLL